jgi:hypothetical protein
MKTSRAHFPNIPAIAYEGPKSDNALAFRHYNPDEIIDGKSLADHLRFSIAYWHAFRGTGSDPNTYIGIIFRRTTNLSLLTGEPVEPAEVLLTLDQSRSHNINGTLSMQFGDDYMEGNGLGNAVLGDLGIFATGRIASGLPYTRLINEAGGQTLTGGIGGNGTVAEQLNASRGPNLYSLDLRLTPGL